MTDNTSTLQEWLNQAAGQTLYIPAGTYHISKPLLVPYFTTVVGAGPIPRNQPENKGTTIIATTAMRAVFEFPSWFEDTWMHCNAVSNMTLDCQKRAQYGLTVHRPGEMFELNRLMIRDAAQSGLRCSGDAATFTANNISIFGSGNYAVQFIQHPSFKHNNGTWRFNGLSGDSNRNGFIFSNTPQQVAVRGIKVEYPHPDGDQLQSMFRVTDEAMISPSPGFNASAQWYFLLEDGTLNNAKSMNWQSVFQVDGQTTSASIEVGMIRRTGGSNPTYWVEDRIKGNNMDYSYETGRFQWSNVRK